MTIDGVTPMDRLIAGDCLAWILQREPAKRPQSCAEVLAHPLFSRGSAPRRASVKQQKMKTTALLDGAIEGASAEDEAKEDAEPLPAGLHIPALHAAAALGHYSAVKSILKSGGGAAVSDEVGPDLNAPEPLIGRRPLHFAATAAQLEIVQLLILLDHLKLCAG